MYSLLVQPYSILHYKISKLKKAYLPHLFAAIHIIEYSFYTKIGKKSIQNSKDDKISV